MADPKDYPFALYLNQKYVFDLLAMMEGGLAKVETIKTTQRSDEESSTKRSGGLGVKNAFALIDISFGGEKSHKDSSGDGTEITREKVHTPNSLFSRLRQKLDAQSLILRGGEYTKMAPGAFVEIPVILQKNPLLLALETMGSLVKIMLGAQKAQHGAASKHGKLPTMPQTLPAVNEMTAVHEIITMLTTELKQGTIDLFGKEQVGSGIGVVLTVDQQFLSDPSLADLVDGQFMVLGKITRVLRGSEDSVNLLRNTAFGGFTDEILEKLREPLNNMRAVGLEFPEIVTRIEAPALQIVPLAIYA
jgi:hypothetical protein